MGLLRLDVPSNLEVLTTLEQQLSDRGIKNAAVVSLIGAVEGCTISTMDANDASRDITTTYQEPLELSGTGEAVNGRLHLHVTVGQQGDVARTGHLHEAWVKTFFVHAYVMPLDE